MYQDPNEHCTVGLNTLPETDTDTAQTWFTACSLLCCYWTSWWSQGQDLLPPPQTFRTRLMLFWLRKTTPLCTPKVIWFKSCIEIDCDFLIWRNSFCFCENISQPPNPKIIIPLESCKPHCPYRPRWWGCHAATGRRYPQSRPGDRASSSRCGLQLPHARRLRRDRCHGMCQQLCLLGTRHTKVSTF